MDKGHTLSQASGRVTLKELKAIIKMGLVQGNLIPAFNSVDDDRFNAHHGGRMCTQ